MIPAFPLDMDSLVSQCMVIFGAVMAGVMGVIVLISLINMGVNWLRLAFGGEYSRRHLEAHSFGGFYDSDGNIVYHYEDGSLIDHKGRVIRDADEIRSLEQQNDFNLADYNRDFGVKGW